MATLKSLMGHNGWTHYVIPKVLEKEAHAIHGLISNKTTAIDAISELRGEVKCCQWFLKFLKADLESLELTLAEQAGVVPSEDDSTPRMPPV